MINSFTGYYLCSVCSKVFRAKHIIEDNRENGYEVEENIHFKKIADNEDWSLKDEEIPEDFTCLRCLKSGDNEPVIQNNPKPIRYIQIKKTSDESAEKDVITLKKGIG